MANLYRTAAMLLLTARFTAAFVPAASKAGRRAFSPLAASDNDFDGFSTKVRERLCVLTT
jgi:hypothetical protein